MRASRTVPLLSALLATALAGAPSYAQTPFDLGKYGIEWQSGLRYWQSFGKHTYNLADDTGNRPVSRLTWDKVEAQAAETFFRADHYSGLFLKGHLGGGTINGGKLKDEDYPPFVVPESSTDSQQRDGRISYGTLDVGYSFLRRPGYRIGAFGGYTVWRDQLNAFGCAQTGGNGGICGTTIPSSLLGISESFEWRSWRVGAVGEFKMTDRMTLTAEAAYLVSELTGSDRHYVRTDLPNATPLDASSDGVQLEMMLSYALDHAFSIGVGGRYWHITEGDGHARFENNGGITQVARFESERYGAFVQGSYKLGADQARRSTKDGYGGGNTKAPFKWTGFYGGVHIGTGRSAGDAAANFDGDANLFGPGIDGGFIPGRLNVDVSGLLGGVQTGYNLRLTQHLVGGIEADVSWARIDGAGTYVDPVSPGEYSTTLERRVNWLGTLRGRLGFLLTPSVMLFGTGGLAVGDTTLELSANDPVCRYYQGCARTASSSSTHYGWTAGGGWEYAISSAMTWKTEYQYVSLGTQSVTARDASVESAAPGNFYTARSDFDLHTVRSGFNFKF